MALFRNKITRQLVFGLGCWSLVLGFIGIFLPIFPTAPFVVFASWCFFKSSPKAYKWLRKQAYIGPMLREWELRRAISFRAKVLATTMILVSLGGIWFKVDLLWIEVSMTILLLAVILFIATRPS